MTVQLLSTAAVKPAAVGRRCIGKPRQVFGTISLPYPPESLHFTAFSLCCIATTNCCPVENKAMDANANSQEQTAAMHPFWLLALTPFSFISLFVQRFVRFCVYPSTSYGKTSPTDTTVLNHCAPCCIPSHSANTITSVPASKSVDPFLDEPRWDCARPLCVEVCARRFNVLCEAIFVSTSLRNGIFFL